MSCTTNLANLALASFARSMLRSPRQLATYVSPRRGQRLWQPVSQARLLPLQGHRLPLPSSVPPTRSLVSLLDRSVSPITDTNMWMNRFGATDVTTNDDSITFQIDVPGLKREDIDISVSSGNVLTIKGSRSSEASGGDTPDRGGKDAATDTGATDGHNKGEDTGRDAITAKSDDGVVKQGIKRKTRWSERSYSSFVRSFQLPPSAKVEAVDASLKDGVLTLTVPTEAPRSIQVKVE